MVVGALAADALALGAHWIYDQGQLEKTFGQVTDYRKPLPDSYHPRKEAGEQTHYGDQSLVLLDSLQAAGCFSEAAFFERWRKMWDNYPDYFDHATKDTLAKMGKGIHWSKAGSDSEELGGAARIAPLLVAMAHEPVEARVNAARRQTALTHASPIAIDAAEFLTRVTDGVLEGKGVKASVEQASEADYAALPMEEICRKVKKVKAHGIRAAAEELGQACPTDQALPTLLALLAKYPNDLETAFIENVMAGGDSAARGLALGMILGAELGRAAIPERWQSGLQAKTKVDEWLSRQRKT